MYINTGYLHQIDIDLNDSSQPLIVESCGNYRLRSLPFMNTVRPLGRKDYQLLYIASGKIFCNSSGEKSEIPAGHMILYRPGVPQSYIYYKEDQPDVYWVHFTGSDVEALLAQYGIPENAFLLHTGTASEYPQTFLRIIHELQVRRPGFEPFIALLLQEIFAFIHRSIQEAPYANRRTQKEVEHALHFFNENYYKPIQIKDYAAARHMSTCWFIRIFQQYTGMSPMQYIISIRIAKAQSLLESTDYNINEISAIVGYENPLYFSRIFKKVTGKAPALYRRTLS